MNLRYTKGLSETIQRSHPKERAMKVLVVIASINELRNIKDFEPMLTQENSKVVVVDESDGTLRRRNDEILEDIPHEYYGVSERSEWFRERFGSSSSKYLKVIPERCHAETSFGFLVAYEEEPDVVLEVDDDVFPVKGHDILRGHISNLFSEDGVTVSSSWKWYNTLENLELNVGDPIFARGHPYSEDTRKEEYNWRTQGGRCVLNMGLWTGHPDLDALTILYYGGLDGRCRIRALRSKRKKIIVGRGTYFAVCSMNTAFRPNVIPAFYQLYMNYMGVNRFDDIWSGLFLKKVADHLGDRVSLGEPVVYHDKRPRDVFKDLKNEMDGLAINETLWRTVEEAEIEGETYWDAYSSLIEEMTVRIPKAFKNPDHKKFLKAQIERMRLWLEIIDKIK